MRRLLFLVLPAVIALGLVGVKIQYIVRLGSSSGRLLSFAYQETSADFVNSFFVKNIGVLGTSPQQNDALSCKKVCGILRLYSYRYLGYRVSGDNGIGQVYFVPRLAKIEIFGRSQPIEIMPRYPAMEPVCSGPSKVLEKRGGEDTNDILVLIQSNINISSGLVYNGPKLFPIVDLGFVGDRILLVDKPITRDGSQNEKEGEKSNSKRPSRYIAMYLIGISAGSSVDRSAIRFTPMRNGLGSKALSASAFQQFSCGSDCLCSSTKALKLFQPHSFQSQNRQARQKKANCERPTSELASD